MRYFQTIRRGFVYKVTEEQQPLVCSGPRTVVTDENEVLCSFMVQPELGVNGFIPMLARSGDGGTTWTQPQPIWPRLKERFSIFCAISRGKGKELYLFGSRTVIDTPGEKFWSAETKRMKNNEIIWARSEDHGISWTLPQVIPKPFPCAAEIAGSLCISSRGRWIGPVAPHSGYDPPSNPPLNQVVVVYSDNEGESWQYSRMLQFHNSQSTSAETWVVELSDGRLVGTAWEIGENKNYPNPYGLSNDGGETWSATCSTGIMGQSTALCALENEKLLFIYNQRVEDNPGVWLALSRPQNENFNVIANERVWSADAITQSGSSGDHDNWTDFAFGEPSVTLMGDGTVLVALWCVQAGESGIEYVRLSCDDEEKS